MTDHLLPVTFVASVLFAAGFIQGTLGFGFQATASGLLILTPGLQPPTNLMMPAMVVNLWQVTAAPSFPLLLRRFGALSAGILVGSAVVRLFDIHGNGVWRASFGLAILATSAAALLFGERKLPLRWERLLSPLVGLSSGVIGGVTGIAFPALLYLTMLKLDANERIAASGSFFIALTPALMVCSGNFTADIGISPSSAWTVVPVILGFSFGQMIYREMDDRSFFRWCQFGVMFMGASLLSL